ncbi:MAG: DUF58 domain-containing protein [Gammaproteobacteria bacterium]|nr:DUF58 domain-containing protein [Gammaproteobacteria bacterium]
MRPTPRLILLVGALAVLALFGLEDTLWRLCVATLLAVALVDLWVARGQANVAVDRRLPPSLPVNRSTEVVLVLSHEYGRIVSARVSDRCPVELGATARPVRVKLLPGQPMELRYTLRPHARGEYVIPSTDMIVDSPLALWQLRRNVEQACATRVYPDFAVIAGYLEMVTDQRISRLGVKLAPRRGEGLEFHQLREYREGDPLRQIDWKATARRRELISREYQEERDQRVMFLIDSGRRMRSFDGELSHFDHALNAMLLLAYVALRQGDSVGLLSFGHAVKWVAPMRGVGSLSVLLNEVFDLQTGPVASDYVAAAEELMARQRKRALVVLMTNLREEDSDLPGALRLLARHHVVMLANLREVSLDLAAQTPVRGLQDALTVAGTADYLATRREIQRSFEPFCHVTLDTVPSELPIRVVNAYWQVKRSGVL